MKALVAVRPRWSNLIILACLLASACDAATPTLPSATTQAIRSAEPPTAPPSTSAAASPAATAYITTDPDEMDARYEAALPLFQYDRDAPLKIKVDSSTEHGDVVVETITYASSTGETVPAVLAHPRNSAGLPGVIWQGPGGPVADRAEILAGLGTIVITINPPQARPSGNIALTYTEADVDQLIELMIEHRRAVDVLIASGADPNRIAYIGYSWGGAMGGALSGIEHRIRWFNLMFADGGVVEHTVETPDPSFVPISGDELDRWLRTMEPLESLYFVRHAEPATFLFQNGLHDEAVAEVSARRLHEMATGRKDIRWYDSGHDPTPNAPEVWCDQAEWFKAELELSSSDVVECSQL